MAPRDKYFRVSFAFGQKATDKILEREISPEIKKELEQAKKYAEGRRLQIIGKDDSILYDIEQLIDIKLNNEPMENTDLQLDNKLISYCGFYCGACSQFEKGQCLGCKGDNPKCAVGYKACKVRPCCIGKGISSCAECNEYSSVKDCKIYNPFLIRFGQFVTRTNRRKGIEMIKEKGENEFIKYMDVKKWVTIKTGKQ